MNQKLSPREWRLLIQCKAQGQPRPRHVRRNGGPTIVYTPGTADEFKSAITKQVRQYEMENLGLTGALRLEWSALFPRPKAHYRTGRRAYMLRDSAPRWHISAPDADNIGKAIADALQASGVIRNDAQFAVVCGTKEYGTLGQVEIIIREI